MRPGEILADRYGVDELVGRGGMGDVFRGHDRVLGRTVALKQLSRDLVDDDEAVARIMTEARLAAKVRHPNVVQVLDAVISDERSPVIVLEFVDGPSLDTVIRERAPLPVDDALDIVGEVAAGLDAAHAADLVHRDVSPGNVLLDAGTARLTDFGLARSTLTSKTMTGAIRGSVAYVAPEQARGTEIGPATDVYALACVAVAMLTGSPPYEADDPRAVVRQHLAAPPPDVRHARPDVGLGVTVALQAAMAKDPDQRIASAAALAAAIGRPLDGAGPLGAVPGPAERPTALADPVPSADGGAPTTAPIPGAQRPALSGRPPAAVGPGHDDGEQHDHREGGEEDR